MSVGNSVRGSKVGTTSDAIAVGGPGPSNSTEEYTAAGVVTKTITTS